MKRKDAEKIAAQLVGWENPHPHLVWTCATGFAWTVLATDPLTRATAEYNPKTGSMRTKQTKGKRNA